MLYTRNVSLLASVRCLELALASTKEPCWFGKYFLGFLGTTVLAQSQKQISCYHADVI